MASPLLHRAVTALAVTLGVGALAASASGMRSIDGELAAATQPPVPAKEAPRTTVQDGDVVAEPICDKPGEQRDAASTSPDPTPTPAPAPAETSREL